MARPVDFILIGVDPDSGAMICRDAVTGDVYTHWETPEEFGLENLTPLERHICGVDDDEEA